MQFICIDNSNSNISLKFSDRQASRQVIYLHTFKDIFCVKFHRLWKVDYLKNKPAVLVVNLHFLMIFITVR